MQGAKIVNNNTIDKKDLFIKFNLSL
jgi:hypothetical protein